MSALHVLLFLCLLWPSIAAMQSNELAEKLKAARGIYEDAALARARGVENAVLVTACNFGFVNHLFNFDCFMRRLKMKYVVFAMDKQAYEFLKANSTINVVSTDSELSSSPQEFRSKHFNLITAKKKEIVHDIMALGYDVLFSDTDVAILQDPVPYLVWKNVDYAHSLNAMCQANEKYLNFFHKSRLEGNTGFYFVRSNERTIKLWADAFAAAPRHPRLDDQAVFWKVLRHSQDPPPLPMQECKDFEGDESKLIDARTGKRYLVSCMLDSCMFSSGMISRMYVPEQTIETLLEILKNEKKEMITVHANYVSGNAKKAGAMKNYGFWLADINDDFSYTCNDYVPFVPQPTNT